MFISYFVVAAFITPFGTHTKRKKFFVCLALGFFVLLKKYRKRERKILFFVKMSEEMQNISTKFTEMEQVKFVLCI